MASFAIGAGLGLLGSWMQSRAQRQQMERAQAMFNQLMGDAAAGDRRAIEQLSQVTPFINDTSHRAGAMLFGDQGNNGSITDLYDWIRSSRPGGDIFSPQFTGSNFNDQISRILGIGQQPQRNNAFADSVYDAQGKTDISGAVGDRALDIGMGQGAPVGALSDTGLGLLGSGGKTQLGESGKGVAQYLFDTLGMAPSLQGLQKIAGDIYTDKGFTPGLRTLSGMGEKAAGGTFGIEGLTPTGAAAQGTALETLLQGGENPATDFLTQRGAELSGKDALIPMDQRIALARDMAGTQGIKTYRKILEKAFRRGGGPANIMAGNQNEVMSEFGDDLLQKEAEAVRNAMTDQQQLQLQEQGQGFGAMGKGQDIATGRTGQAGDLASKLENASTARFNVGGGLMSDAEKQATMRTFEALGLIPQTESLANERLKTGFGIGSGMEGLDLSRMKFGGDLLNSYNDTRLRGLNLAMAPEEFAMKNLFNASGLRNSTATTQGDLFNTFLNAGKFNTDQTRSFYDILGGAQGREYDMNKLLAELGMRSSGMGADIAQIFAGMANNARSAATGAMGGAMGSGQSPFGNYFRGVGQGIGSGDWSLPGFRPSVGGAPTGISNPAAVGAGEAPVYFP